MATRQVERLVDRVRQKPGGKTHVKLRTLLTAFGYSRRTGDVVKTVQEQLGAHHITVNFSVSDPPTLDDRVTLVFASPSAVPSAETTPPLVESSHQPKTGPAGVGAAAPIEDATPVSLAGRLFRAALSIFEKEPPIVLGLEGMAAMQAARASRAVPATPNAEGPVPKTVSPPRAPQAETHRSDDARPIAAARESQRREVPPTDAPDLSHVAESTVRATVLVQLDKGFGSAFLVHRGGLVVTACHVLDSPTGLTTKAKVRFHDGAEATATLVCAHRPLDYALLWLDDGRDYPALDVGRPKALRYAETVLAVGHPGVSDETGEVRALRNTVSTGVVSNPACTERGVDWIQMTTDIDPGNSGGPLVNRFGQAVGVNCWKFTRVAAAKMALPIDYLADDIANVMTRGRELATGGRLCTICGSREFDVTEWFCVTCGAAYQDASSQG